MHFWETCLLRTLKAFAFGNPAGRGDAEWWLDEVDRQSLLQWDQLGPSALVSVLRTVGRRHPFGIRARRLLTRFPHHALEVRTFADADVAAAIKSLWADRRDDDRSAIGEAGAVVLYAQEMTDFLSRFYLAEEEVAAQESLRDIRQIYLHWNGQGSFRAALFHRMWNRTRYSGSPRWPYLRIATHQPSWWATPKLAERLFLAKAASVDEIDRKIVFQTIYAGMTPEEVAATALAGRPWPPALARLTLRQGWSAILR